jgi:hypothetical protein
LSLRGAERRSNLGGQGFRSSTCGSAGGCTITFSQTLTFVIGLLYLEKRVSYRRLRKEFGLDEETIEDLRHELIVKRLAVDEGGQGLAFVGTALFETSDAPTPAFAPIAAQITPAPAATAAAPEAERRQLTVMFCDLVGSTALSTGMDPEDLRDVIASFQNRCNAAIRRYDGFVAKYMGDGILVYFGYPRAHEDEAERSVRAGLDIVEAARGRARGTDRHRHRTGDRRRPDRRRNGVGNRGRRRDA